MKTLSFLSLPTVSCDSGNLVIVDPCYLKNSKNIDSLIDRGFATNINTEIGDGEFSIEKKRDRQGRLKQIIINID
ncbi:MAG: hypothetical protein CM15mV43_720 [uncultured marine virus]|jgi:hypothetical protein|nr:MAG: hypothetical protein CM15mV43_720 [uncultured marine virus]|tara:strand:- start:1587 stop:1811 length:225 start_codon:yes stop_codon:yes gene_type:complete